MLHWQVAEPIMNCIDDWESFYRGITAVNRSLSGKDLLRVVVSSLQIMIIEGMESFSWISRIWYAWHHRKIIFRHRWSVTIGHVISLLVCRSVVRRCPRPSWSNEWWFNRFGSLGVTWFSENLFVEFIKTGLRGGLLVGCLQFRSKNWLIFECKRPNIFYNIKFILTVAFGRSRIKTSFQKSTPRRGIEPRSPAWQAGILTTILTWSWPCASARH